MDVLRKFYRDVQPIGFWGPVKAELPAEERKSVNVRARAEIIACCWGVSCYFSMVLATFSAMGGNICPRSKKSASAKLVPKRNWPASIIFDFVGPSQSHPRSDAELIPVQAGYGRWASAW